MNDKINNYKNKYNKVNEIAVKCVISLLLRLDFIELHTHISFLRVFFLYFSILLIWTGVFVVISFEKQTQNTFTEHSIHWFIAVCNVPSELNFGRYIGQFTVAHFEPLRPSRMFERFPFFEKKDLVILRIINVGFQNPPKTWFRLKLYVFTWFAPLSGSSDRK